MKWGLWKGKLVCPIVSLLFFVFLAFPGTGLADGGSETGELEQIVNGYHVQLIMDQPAYSGETAVQIKLTDSQSQPVEATVVQITLQSGASLSDHSEAAPEDHDSGHTGGAESGHDDAVNSEHTDSHASEAGGHDDSGESAEHSHGASFDLHSTNTIGQYSGKLIFEEPGQWDVAVLFIVGSSVNQANFPMGVLQADSTPTVLTIFSVVNVVIVASAFVLKRKSAGPTAA